MMRALLLSCLLLAGCSGRLNGGLLPVSGTVPGASEVNVLVATTRKPAPEPERMFGGERDVKYNFADILVSIPPDANRVIGEVQSPDDTSGDPSRQFVALRSEILDKDEARKRFNQRLVEAHNGHVLVFVHGYNTRFSEAVFRLAQFAHDAHLQETPILFTWPSRGSLLGYGYDRESANYSRDALEALLNGLQRDPAVTEIDILAHSMGNWVTLEALRQMAIRDRKIAPKIKQVIMAAPDVDVDVFRRQISQIGEPRPPFTMFVSRDDKALQASRVVWDGQRIGAVDPNAEPYASFFRKERITPIDLTDISSPDSLDHTKFADEPGSRPRPSARVSPAVRVSRKSPDSAAFWRRPRPAPPRRSVRRPASPFPRRSPSSTAARARKWATGWRRSATTSNSAMGRTH